MPSESVERLRARLSRAGTVTALLETHTGEPLRAEVVGQGPVPAAADNGLAVAAGQMVTYRAAVLKGGVTHAPYVYAETIYLPERLPDRARAELAHGEEPIGRILVAHGLALSREPFTASASTGPSEGLALQLGCEFVWGRAYRLLVGGVAVFAIGEWFTKAALGALGGPSPGPAGAEPAG
jgi:chorismate-pyruvate lyase